MSLRVKRRRRRRKRRRRRRGRRRRSIFLLSQGKKRRRRNSWKSTKLIFNADDVPISREYLWSRRRRVSIIVVIVVLLSRCSVVFLSAIYTISRHLIRHWITEALRWISIVSHNEGFFSICLSFSLSPPSTRRTHRQNETIESKEDLGFYFFLLPLPVSLSLSVVVICPIIIRHGMLSRD